MIALFLVAALAVAARSADAQPSLGAADFVVVGGGTAGCAVAATVCRSLPKAKIIVLERGLPRSRAARRRASAARLMVRAWDDPELMQVFQSAPNPALNGRRVRVMLGSNIGGSSAVNAAKFTMPPAWYYGSLGIAGLNAAVSQKLFARVRSALNPIVPPPPLAQDYTWAWIGAAARAGLPFLPRPFDGARTNAGSWPPRAAFDAKGRRVDAYRGFLRPAMAGPCKGRVRIIRGATVRRVRFRGARAVSVEVQTRGGATRVVNVRREVLLAAGAVNSAAVLQRSGVGPRALLQRLKIPVVRNLPVGVHMQTRPTTVLSTTYTKPLARANNQTLLAQPWVTAAFDAGRGGPLGVSPFGPNARLPGVGYFGMRIAFENKPRGKDGASRLGTSCQANAGWNSFSAVRIASRDAKRNPVLDLRLLAKRADLQRSMRLTRKGRMILKGLEKPLGAKEFIFRKGETSQTLDTPRGLEKKVRADTYGSNHYVGGCAVGRVVDARLRVKNVQGLRVVDSGAIRRIPPNAGPLTSVYIVALRAADIVVEDNRDLRK